MTKKDSNFRALALPALESIRLLMAELDDPQKAYPCIHVAGTNGKGSVCAYLQAMFTRAGIRTGKYISPHLIHECERISVDGTEISPGELNRWMRLVEAAAEKTQKRTGTPPTMFELWTAAAFCYFREQNCGMVILETGLGGTHDATNIIPPPAVSVITRIDLDHMDYLGTTLAQVAAAKAGIIKQRPDGKPGLTVTVPQPPEAMAVLVRRCREKNHRLVVIQAPSMHSPVGMGECFDYGGLKRVRLRMPGVYQIENACLAVEAARGAGLPAEVIRYGLEAAVNPARLETVWPGVIFDGAHNQNGMRALIQSLDRYFPHTPRAFVFGCMRDKEIPGVLAEMARTEGPVKAVYTVGVQDSQRAMPPAALAALAQKAGLPARPADRLSAAVAAARESGGLCIVCGSLYLYQELRQMQKNWE